MTRSHSLNTFDVQNLEKAERARTVLGEGIETAKGESSKWEFINEIIVVNFGCYDQNNLKVLREHLWSLRKKTIQKPNKRWKILQNT
jgi:hypothetical protein